MTLWLVILHALVVLATLAFAALLLGFALKGGTCSVRIGKKPNHDREGDES